MTTNPNPKTITRIALMGKDQFRLMSYVQEHYTAKGLTDTEFAHLAATELALPQINANHVAGCRRAFEIPSTRQVRVPSPSVSSRDLDVLTTRLSALEAEFAELKSVVSRILTNLAKGATR